MPIKVLDANGSGEEFALAEAIHLAADYGADVINMSLGFPAGTQASELQLLAEAVTYAYSRGVTIVAAAGNDAAASCSYPAAFPEVICVGATKYDGNLAWYSNYGTDLELVAPGGAYCASANDLLCLLLGYPYYFNDQNGDGWPDGVLQETFGCGLYVRRLVLRRHVHGLASCCGCCRPGHRQGEGPGSYADAAAGPGHSQDQCQGQRCTRLRQHLRLGPGRCSGRPGTGRVVTAKASDCTYGPSRKRSFQQPDQSQLADNSSNETGFKIYSCTGSNCTNFSQIATVGANVTSYAIPA